MSRIFGKVWYYLMLWAWGTAALLLLAVGWTVAVAVGERIRPDHRAAARRVATGAGIGIVGLSVIVFLGDAVDAPPPSPTESRILGDLVPETVAALERGVGDAVGPDGTYLVEWTDAYYFGSQGYGLVSELERAGLDARTAAHRHVPITDHRVVDDPLEADATVYLVTGQYIEAGSERCPAPSRSRTSSPATPAELAEFDQLAWARWSPISTPPGLDDIVPIVDRNLFGASIDERVPVDTQRAMARMLDLGQPAAVFIAPAGTVLQ